MIEEDQGALSAVVSAVVKSVEKELTEAVEKAISTAASSALTGMATGAAVGSAVPLIGPVVGAAAGTAVGLVAAEIKRARKDDVFDPKKVHLPLHRFPSDGGEIQGSKDTVVFKDFQGHYVVTYSWAIS